MFNKLYKSRSYPLLVQVLTLLIFILLVIGGIGITTDSSAIAKQLRNTNLSNLVVWSYWWPLIIVSAVFFGRQWCSVCPIELVSAVLTKIGLKRKAPKFIKSGWLITILYAFVAVVAIHTWGIHRIPHRMALYLLSLFGLAIVVSLVFEKRAFCSYLCPVGKLLGIYSLMASLGLRVKSKDVCKSCKTKDCIHKDNHYKLIGRSCTSELYPLTISDNRDCILCSQCVKACPNDNISLQNKRKSFVLFDLNKLGWAEVGMITILVGFVCYEILSSWSGSKSSLLALPAAMHSLLQIEAVSIKLLEGIVLFLILPALFMVFFSGIAKASGKGSFSFYLKRTAGFLLPVIAFGHVFKALLKTTSRIPYWKYAIEQPKGVEYAENIVNKLTEVSQIDWLTLFVIFLGIFGLIAGLYLSLRKIRFDNEISGITTLVYYAVVLIFFAILIYGPVSGFLV